MIRKNIYKWHRICSLIIAIPVLLWATSGFMHPIMTNLRPALRSQSIQVETVDGSKIKLTLKQVLKQNHVDSIYSVRLVHIDTNWFYQVKTSRDYDLQYISVKNGNILTKGDWLYAQYLARIFLEGPAKKARGQMAVMEMPANMPINDAMDCCGEAASTVLNNKTGAPILGASRVTSFNGEYKSIYCLLPVWKVSFKRSDNIRLYVETGQDRFSIAVDKNRAAFTSFFDIVHTWGWINFLGKGRLLVVMLLAGLGFFTAVMGLYIFFSTKSKKVKGNPLVKARRNHRYTAVIASVFTLMFTFSGCYQALSEFTGHEKVIQSALHEFASSAIDLDLAKLHTAVKKPITNIGLAQVNGKTYWPYLASAIKSHHNKDLMKDMSADADVVNYVNAEDYSILAADEQYAKNLASQFMGKDQKAIISTELITRFTNEYNFTDKRLPVWKINYSFNHKQRLYVETTTGVLAKNTNDMELIEGYSFALFHKHHYMDFAGKTTRDVSTMIGAGLQIMLVVIGLIFYFKWRKRKVNSNVN